MPVTKSRDGTPDRLNELLGSTAEEACHQQVNCVGRVQPLTTPDGRYVIVRGRLWRAANPNLSDESRAAFISQLMEARREVKTARRELNAERLAKARSAVNAAKIALGERGPIWWTDGAKDFNRHLVQNTPYASWYRSLGLK